ncbi:MAG: ABC transporter substrate-binding protein [Desulfurococcales archaeon]|nr:ABC transporter substrate-binding protein [Desulfurococcales archaeon]
MISASNRIITIVTIVAVALAIIVASAVYKDMNGSSSRGVYLDPRSGYIEARIGVMADLTGPTRDIGRGYYQGVMAALLYFNATGVETSDGKRVVFHVRSADHQYKPYLAEEYYNQFKQYGILAIIGYGTADSIYISDEVQRDRVLYISASYASTIARNPYIFYPAPDYATQACTGVAWAANHVSGTRLALVYDFDTAYGRDPIPALMHLASRLGLEIAGEVDLNLDADEASMVEATRRLVKLDPDMVWCGGDLDSCASLVRALSTTSLDPVFVVNVWGFGEQFPLLAGEYSYGRTFGISPFMYPSMARERDLPGWYVLRDAAETLDIPVEEVNVRFVQGFLNGWLLVQAIERTSSSQLLQHGGEALKESLESSCTGEPFTFGGLTAEEARFCPGHHSAFDKVFIMEVGVDGVVRVADVTEPPPGLRCSGQ